MTLHNAPRFPVSNIPAGGIARQGDPHAHCPSPEARP